MPPLLPRKQLKRGPRNTPPEDATWTEAPGHGNMVPLTLQGALTNLIADDLLQVEGVPIAIAPAIAFEWRLRAAVSSAAHQDAMSELRFLLFARTLNHVDVRTLNLRDKSVLKGILREEFEADSIDVWLPRKPVSGMPRVIAAQVGSAFPLFPSAAVQSEDGRRRVGSWLSEVSNGLVRVDSDPPALKQGDRRDYLRNLLVQWLKALPEQSPWHQAFETIQAE